MKNPTTTDILLLVIAVGLIAIALKPLRQPQPAKAQSRIVDAVSRLHRTRHADDPIARRQPKCLWKNGGGLIDGPCLGISNAQQRALSRRHIQPQAARVSCHLPGHVRLGRYV